MRRKIVKLKAPKRGNVRVKTAFLIFPKIIRDEQRWWERVYWIETYTCLCSPHLPCECDLFDIENIDSRWEPTSWIDTKESYEKCLTQWEKYSR